MFDLLTFNVDANDVVTLAGYVVTETLKKDAEREAREVKGVKKIQNKIVIAPLFPLDDEIRHGVYHAIYWDSALSRYSTSDNELPSIRPGFRRWGSGFGGWGRRFNGPGARVDSRRFGGLHLIDVRYAARRQGVLMSSNRSGAVPARTWPTSSTLRQSQINAATAPRSGPPGSWPQLQTLSASSAKTDVRGCSLAVVAGTAPDVVTDMDMNGVIDEKDLELMGIPVVSNVVKRDFTINGF